MGGGNAGEKLSPDLHRVPDAGDGRPSIAAILEAFDALAGRGWRAFDIASQAAPSGGVLPIRAYANGEEASAVLIGGIHGREPAGAVALAQSAVRLAEAGTHRPLLVMPLLNPWGYLRHERYGPSGESVTDCGHLLGRVPSPACPEAAAIAAFVMHPARIRVGAPVLDLHEDPVYEARDYCLEGFGSYVYLAGEGAAAHPITRRILASLDDSALPLLARGRTRFGDRIARGVILDAEDASIDELLARRLGCSPVITVENLLQAPDSPPLGRRVAAYAALIEAFLAQP